MNNIKFYLGILIDTILVTFFVIKTEYAEHKRLSTIKVKIK